MVSEKKSTLLAMLVLLAAVLAVSVASSNNYNKNLTPANDEEFLSSPAILIESLYAGTELFHSHTAVFMASIGLLFISYVIDRRLLPVSPRNRQPEQNKYRSCRQSALSIPKQYFHQNSTIIKFLQELNRKRVPDFTKSHFSSLHKQALILVAQRAEQKITFSPGFIFVRLARGPPNLTCETIINLHNVKGY